MQSIKSDDGEVDTKLTKAEYAEVHNLDEEDPEGGAGSPVCTDSLQYQVEAPSHTCFDPFFIPDPLLQFPAGK